MFVGLKIMAAIFYQILFMSVVATVISLVILLIQKIINNKISPKCYYFIWIVFIFVLAFPISIPSKISVYNYIDVSSVRIIDNTYRVNNWVNLNDKKNTIIYNINDGVCNNNYDINEIDFRIIIADILLIISLIKVLITVISHFMLISEFGNNQLKDERVLNILDKCKNQLKIKRNIKLINQNIINSPAIIGIINVKVLFTDECKELDDESLKNIFSHELAHYKRKDNFMNFLIMILNSLYWFNPFVKNGFQYIKQYMEFSTDGLAIKNMNIEETREYCRTIVEEARRKSEIVEPVLGFSSGFSYIRKRIDFISLKPKFNKFSKVISFFTVFLISIICLIFYPTSYGYFNTPGLFLQTENGEIIEITKQKENIINMVVLKENEKAKVMINNSKLNNCIYFNKVNSENSNEKVTNIIENNMICFEKGEHIYNFTVANVNGKMYNYFIKIIVE